MDKIKNALIIIAIYVALGIVLMIFIVKFQSDLGRQKAIEAQEKVIAHISALQPNIQEGKKKTYYNVYYEYSDENGMHYSGVILVLTTDEEYAKSLIGNEVEIYIDGKGNSILVSEVENFDVNRHKNWCIIIGAIIAAYTVVWIALVIRSNIISVPKNRSRKEKTK